MATDMTNLALEACNMDDIVDRLGESAPRGTRALLTRRCVSKMAALQNALNDLISELRDACGAMEQACDIFEGLVGTDPSLDDPRADVALCTSLTHRQACRIVKQIVEMYKNELRVKIKVADDFSQACMKLFSNAAVDRGFWHVHIAAWMMDVYISRDIVDQKMSEIALDAGMPYSSPYKNA